MSKIIFKILIILAIIFIIYDITLTIISIEKLKNINYKIQINELKQEIEYRDFALEDSLKQ